MEEKKATVKRGERETVKERKNVWKEKGLRYETLRARTPASEGEEIQALDSV